MSNEDIFVGQNWLYEISLINGKLVRSLNQTAIERIRIGYFRDIQQVYFAYRPVVLFVNFRQALSANGYLLMTRFSSLMPLPTSLLGCLLLYFVACRSISLPTLTFTDWGSLPRVG